MECVVRWEEPDVVALDIRRGTRRLAYLDRIKVLLVAGIIATHGIFGYSSFAGSWAYQPVREVELATPTEMVLGSLLLPATLFVMGVFFLVSGLVVPGALTRHGTAGFVRDRLLRLGVPYAVWVLLLWPAVVWAPRRVAGWTASYWQMFLGAEPFLDAGAMWFVGVLLLYSLGYAAWCAWRASHGPQVDRALDATAHGEVTARTVGLLAAGVSATTVVVRVVFPFDSHQVAEVQLWQWPQYLALFGLGVVAGRRGLLQPVPPGLRRVCGRVALVSLVAFGVLLGAVVAQGLDPGDAFTLPLPHWAPLTLAVIEGPLSVAASVWVLGAAQQHLDRSPGPLGRAVARGAYAAYVVQGAVLIGAAVALRPVPVAAELKAVTVAAVGVLGSFAVGWLLVRRTPVGRLM